MCGIFGIVGKDSSQSITAALTAIKHRGPDDQGELKDKQVHIGFRRLSIIDLSAKGHQPMSNEDKTVWIIFNGEIYNYQDVKKLLKKHRFRSETDTEVLIHGYEEWGIDGLLQRINGMFALCLYDQKTNTTYLVRDRIGKKPLYYYKTKDHVVFSSEIKAFFALKEFALSFDEETMNTWMGFPYLPDNEKTILEDVYKVPPGSYLKCHDGKTSIHSYWQIAKAEERSESMETAAATLETLLSDSVSRRLIADVPVGILLSGGLDSSLITALAAKYSKNKINTLTVLFEGSGIDESEYAATVAKHCGTSHQTLSLNVPDAYQTLKDHIEIYDDLSTTDSGLLSTYLLSQKIRETGVKVILVGEGADEIFSGYSWFQFGQYPFSFMPKRLKSFMYHYAIMRQFPNQRIRSYADILHNKIEETDGSYIKKIQAYEIRYSLPNHYCMKVDKGSMAASVEARAPYMDYRVVNFARSVKSSYLLRSRFYNPRVSNEKYILRQIAQKYLPTRIAGRKKKGGMVPVHDMVERGIREDQDVILQNKILTEFFGKQYLENLIAANPKTSVGRWQREWVLWKCLLFSLWHHHMKRL